LVQLAGVDGPLHHVERPEPRRGEVPADQVAVLLLGFGVVRVGGGPQAHEAGVVGGQEVPELAGEGPQDVALLRRQAQLEPASPGPPDPELRPPHAWAVTRRAASWPTGRGHGGGTCRTRPARGPRWTRPPSPDDARRASAWWLSRGCTRTASGRRTSRTTSG